MFFNRIISTIEDLKLFDLCREFGKLSLDEDEDNGESSSTNQEVVQHLSSVQPSSYGSITSLLRSWNHTPWNKSITKQLKAPFMEYPRSYMDALQCNKSEDLKMGFGFRFLPGQSEFLRQELKLPENFDKLTLIKNKMGLSYSSISPFSDNMLPYRSSGAGLRCLVTNSINKILVEVVTYCDGRYGRILVLVCLGVGCTVWYGFAPGTFNCPPVGGVFTPFHTYESFFDSNYYAPELTKIHLNERNDITDTVAHAIGNEQPFAEIMIPASGTVLKAVGLGVMVSIFLAVGIVPHATNEIMNL